MVGAEGVLGSVLVDVIGMLGAVVVDVPGVVDEVVVVDVVGGKDVVPNPPKEKALICPSVTVPPAATKA